MLLQRTSCKVLTLFHIYLYLVIPKWHLFVQVATMFWVGQDLSKVFLSSNQNLPLYSHQVMLTRKQKSVFWHTQSVCIYKLHRNTCKTIRRNHPSLDFCQVSKTSLFLSKGCTYSFDSFSDSLPALLLLKYHWKIEWLIFVFDTVLFSKLRNRLLITISNSASKMLHHCEYIFSYYKITSLIHYTHNNNQTFDNENSVPSANSGNHPK